MFPTLTFAVELATQKVSLISRNHTGVVWGEPSRRNVVNQAQGAFAIVTRPVSARGQVQPDRSDAVPKVPPSGL